MQCLQHPPAAVAASGFAQESESLETESLQAQNPFDELLGLGGCHIGVRRHRHLSPGADVTVQHGVDQHIHRSGLARVFLSHSLVGRAHDFRVDRVAGQAVFLLGQRHHVGGGPSLGGKGAHQQNEHQLFHGKNLFIEVVFQGRTERKVWVACDGCTSCCSV